MAVVHVIQVWAHHGVGMQGWRTVSRRAGEPYCFQTREAALAAMRKHFANLREGINVRVHAISEDPEALSRLAAPPDPNVSSAS